jgi:hypothetical protein
MLLSRAMTARAPLTLDTPIVELSRSGIPRFGQGWASPCFPFRADRFCLWKFTVTSQLIRFLWA